jgi:hypothetical protein
MKINFNTIATLTFCLLAISTTTFSAPVIRQVGGANAAAIQATVDQFRTDLGGGNNGVNGSFTSGRREINWDGVPDAFAEPNNLPLDFFNVNSPRGVIFNAVENDTGAALNQFAVSANSTNPTNTAVRFANLNAAYSTIFQTFSPQRLFIARNTNIMEVNFSIPGTNIPATVNGFGVVFCDVDSSTGGDRSLIRLYDKNGRQLSAASAPVADNGLSFVGISFNAGERIARVVIEIGNAALSASNTDGINSVDVVAMDDFIYGEPRAAESHPSDFDGDGTTDRSVFRPSTGEWFVFNSGTNTLSGGPFGTAGDLPVEGDFDGDHRSDFAIYRPSTGQWIFLRSSNGTAQFVNFGTTGDVPVPGDYDKDGITDPAVWRASSTGWFFLKSSTNYTTFDVLGFGLAGDKPIPATAP